MYTLKELAALEPLVSFNFDLRNVPVIDARRIAAVDIDGTCMKVTYLLGPEEDLSKLTNSSADNVELILFSIGQELKQEIKIAGVMFKEAALKSDKRVTEALMAHFSYDICNATITHDAGELPVAELHVDAATCQEVEIVYSHKGVSFLPKV